MLNSVVVAGRVVKDGELKARDGKEEYCVFSLAFNHKDEYCEFIDCVSKKELQKFLHKGDKVVVCGKLTVKKYESKVYPRIIVDSLELMTPKAGD